MILKMRSLVIVSILGMLFSGVTCGDNRLFGGIGQDKPCVEPCYANSKYKEIATALGADYYPMYNDGLPNDVKEVRKAALGEATDQNGLKALLQLNANEKHFDTIVAYSGGTSTAVTALADYSKYGITCDTLILVSPMAAAVSDATLDRTVLGKKIVPHGDTLGGAIMQIMDAANSADSEANPKFEKQIVTILKNNPNLKIIVIQSPQDKPTPKSEAYQYTFTKGENGAFKEFENRITIHNEPLDSKGLLDKGVNAHTDLFFEFAKSHLAKDGSGIKFSPTDQSIGSSLFLDVSQIPGIQYFPAGSTETGKKKTQGSNWLGDNYGFTSWEEEDKMIRESGGYARPAPGSSGLPPEKQQAIQGAIDSMAPVGEYNHYDSTIPVYNGPPLAQ